MPKAIPLALACFAAPFQRAGDVVVFGHGGGDAGALPDAAIGDARQRLGAHLGGLVDGVDQMRDGAVGVDRGPALLRQAERADGAHLVLVEQGAGMGGVDDGGVEQGDLDEIHLVGRGGGNGALRALPVPPHGPHAGMNAETFHRAILPFAMAIARPDI